MKSALSPAELESLFVAGKVNGEEREYSLKELLDIRQTQDAASSKLEEYKALMREARESVREDFQHQASPAVDVVDEYMTDEERRVRNLESQLQELHQKQVGIEEANLASREEAHMKAVFQQDGLSEAEAAQRIAQIANQYPDAAKFASDLFVTNPSSQADLERRISTFNTIWQLNKTIEMPEVVRRVAAEAEDRGRTQAKVDAKRQLTSVDGGASAEARTPSRGERIQHAAESGTDKDWANLLLEGPVFKNL
jgi:hypothetical protein